MNKKKRPLSWIVFGWAGLAVLACSRQPRLFDVRNINTRKQIPKLAERIIDYQLFREKCKAIEEPGYKFKYPEVMYTRQEIEKTRFCSKGNNGLVFLNDIYRNMYRSVQFVGMVRHPLSLYESWSRRSAITSPEQFAHFYNRIAGKMIEEEARGGYRLITFESLMAEPLKTCRCIYRFLGLDGFDTMKFRLKAKKHYKDDGSYGTDLTEGAYYWYNAKEIDAYFGQGINKKVEALEKRETQKVLDLTEKVRQHIGYSASITEVPAGKANRAG